MSDWGPLVGVSEVRTAVADTLKEWIDDALVVAAGAAGVDERRARPPRSWKRVADFRNIPEDQLPCLFVTSPGLAGPPQRHGDGTHTATWRAVVTALVRGKSYDDTADMVSVYCLAIRAVCLQRNSLGGFAESTRWTGEDYDALETSQARTLGAGFVDLDVTVAKVVDAKAGPPGPRSITSVNVDVDPMEGP